MADENAAGSESNTDTSAAESQAESGNLESGATEGNEGNTGDQAANNAAESGADNSGENGDTASLIDGYSFNVPEGMSVDEGLAKSVAPVLKEAGLSQEQADKLTGAYAEHIQKSGEAAQTAHQEAYDNQQSEWLESLRNDTDFGGDNFDQNAEQVKTFIDKTAPNDEVRAELTEMFDTTGVGSHPALVKWLFGLSKLMPVGEDGSMGSASSQSSGSQSKEQRAATRSDRMY